jgi:4-amino-4-deoxy-L-arabinose transferase-like glycosyltransferase
MGLPVLRRWVAIIAAGYALFVFGSSGRGLVGPDEPRYASIARDMARSGDWITPRLGGEPWFEKPALLYWMGAAAHAAGFESDLATRLPVGLLSIAFLIFFHWRLSRHFGLVEADYATVILATSAGWTAFSQAGIFDLPLAASLGAALLLLLPWVENRDDAGAQGALPLFGLLLGVSALAKGLVGPVLAALAVVPVCFGRGVKVAAKDLFHPRVLGAFFVVAAPWYALCTIENGWTFLSEFFGTHHFARFLSESLQHVQPTWYFLPVLLIGLLPWTPLLALFPNAAMRRDPRVQFLLGWALTTLVFFSISTNKVAGYILPALPPLAALVGIRLARVKNASLFLGSAGFLLLLVPLAEALLPAALSQGLRDAWPPEGISWLWAAPLVAAAGIVGWLDRTGRRNAAVMLLAACTVASLIHLKTRVFSAIDEQAGTRSLWHEIEPHVAETCVGDVRRHVVYGLSYYSDSRLQECSSSPQPYRVESDPPQLTRPTTSHLP